MTQQHPYYPPPAPQQPYSPAQTGAYGYGYPYPDPLAPAKRAGMLMFVLGGLMLLCGMCFGAISAMPFNQLPPESQQQMQQFQEKLHGMPLDRFAVITAVKSFVPGLVFIILGFFVRRGAPGPVMAGIVVCCLAILGIVADTFVSVYNEMDKLPQNSPGFCFWLVPLILLIFLLVFLIQAARSAGRIAAAQQQYVAQYYQYQQAQRMYQQPSQYPPQIPQQQPQQQPPPPPPPANQV